MGAPVNREQEGYGRQKVGVLNGGDAGEVGENYAAVLFFFFLIGKNVKGVISQEKCNWSRKFRIQQTGSLDPLSPPPLKCPTSPYTNELVPWEQALPELLGV